MPRKRGSSFGPDRHDAPTGRQPDPVAGLHRSGRARRVEHSPGDLPRGDTSGGCHHGGQVGLDVGLGFFDENIQITKLHRECIDLNFHWFATSHVEVIFTGRFETLAFGAAGPNAGYALAQLHYRL